MCKFTNTVMAKYIKQFPLTSKVLQQLISTENSCVEIENHKKHITLFPYHMKSISASIKEILDEDIGRFDKDLDGILLGYKNIKLLTNLGVINNDSCFIHLDIQADFVIFKPVPEKELPAIVTKKSRDHVGCLVYHTFNVSLPKPEEIENWTGSDVEIGQEIIVRVTYANLDAKLPYIKGEFLNNISEYADSIYKEPVNKKIIFEEENEETIEQEVKEKKKKKKKYLNTEEIEGSFDDIDYEDKIDNNSKSQKVKEKKKKKRKYLDTEEEIEDSFDVIENEVKIDNSTSQKVKEKMLKELKYSNTKEEIEYSCNDIENESKVVSPVPKKVKETKKKKRKYSNTEEEIENSFDGVMKNEVEIDNSIDIKTKIESDSSVSPICETQIKKKRKILSQEDQACNFDTEIMSNSLKKKKKHSLTKESEHDIDIELKNESPKKKKKHSKSREG